MGAGRGISHFIPNYDVLGSLCWLGQTEPDRWLLGPEASLRLGDSGIC